MSERIAILGVTGAGKSTLSRVLAERTGLPLFHMDALFWRSNWTEVSETEYIQGQKDILANNSRWIIEGWVNENLVERLRQADRIIYLDYPGFICAWRYVRRAFKHRKVARPELPEDCFDRFKLHRFFIILFRGERPEIEEGLRLAGATEKTVRIRWPFDAKRFLQRGELSYT